MTIDKERLRVLIKELRTDARVDSLFGGAARNKLSERAADVLTEFEAENAALAAEVERLRKDEREACALVCDAQAETHELLSNTQATKGCDECANAIRARGSNVT